MEKIFSEEQIRELVGGLPDVSTICDKDNKKSLLNQILVKPYDLAREIQEDGAVAIYSTLIETTQEEDPLKKTNYQNPE